MATRTITIQVPEEWFTAKEFTAVPCGTPEYWFTYFMNIFLVENAPHATCHGTGWITETADQHTYDNAMPDQGEVHCPDCGGEVWKNPLV
jgi:hypothetical protein